MKKIVLNWGQEVALIKANNSNPNKDRVMAQYDAMIEKLSKGKDVYRRGYDEVGNFAVIEAYSRRKTHLSYQCDTYKIYSNMIVKLSDETDSNRVTRTYFTY